MELDNVYDKVISCSKCGFCQPTCPTYLVSGLEHEVARGRHQLVRSIIEEKLPMNKDVKNTIFQCLMCNACYTNCFPKIKTDQVIARARYEYIKRFGQPQLQRYIFKYLLRHPDTLGRFLKMASVGKRSGISGLVQVLRILGWFGKNIANAEKLLDKIPFKSLRERADEISPGQKTVRGKVAYFAGCGINFANPDIGLATLQVLKQRGFQVEILPNYCCGLPAYAYGDLDSVKWFAEQNFAILEQTDADFIVTDCGSCTSFLKEYHRFVNPPDKGDRIERVLNRVIDFTHLLADTEEFAEYKTNDDKQKITFHDPCHLAHHLNEKQSSRKVLSNLPGLDFVELNESDFCCGGAGSYNIAHYDISRKILERKLNNVESSGADILATACPACIIQLAWGVRNTRLPVVVKHISQVVLEKSIQGK
ncbi:(Fe-S)-binding protein [candidate division KSB1 bacterium]|nr:(Fe-S)-binding protein [candidate division KSB1 bacterium]